MSRKLYTTDTSGHLPSAGTLRVNFSGFASVQHLDIVRTRFERDAHIADQVVDELVLVSVEAVFVVLGLAPHGAVLVGDFFGEQPAEDRVARKGVAVGKIE